MAKKSFVRKIVQSISAMALTLEKIFWGEEDISEEARKYVEDELVDRVLAEADLFDQESTPDLSYPSLYQRKDEKRRLASNEHMVSSRAYTLVFVTPNGNLDMDINVETATPSDINGLRRSLEIALEKMDSLIYEDVPVDDPGK